MLPLHIEDCKLYFPIKHILINKFYYFNTLFNNGSQLMNPEFPENPEILILNSQCVEGAKYVRIH